MKVISMTNYNFPIDFPPGDDAFYKMPDVLPSAGLTAFANMTPPRTTSGTGSNSLNSLGVWMGASSTGATEDDPYQRNFFIVKVDHCGFNSVTPSRFFEGANQFTYVQTGPNVIEIQLPEPPLSKALPVTQVRPVSMTAAQMIGIQKTMQGGGYDATNVIWNEHHPTGFWQYMQLPAGYGGSLKMGYHGDLAGWQRLIDLGFRPKQCKTLKYRLMVEPKGQDGIEMLNAQNKLAQLGPMPGTIPVSNLNPGTFTAQAYEGRVKVKHQKAMTDWTCQFSTAISSPNDDFAGASARYFDLIAQGFDVMAFGGGIIFQFVQYAPPTRDTTPVTTAACQIVPVTINVHNKCIFSTPRIGSKNDLYQVASLPIVANGS